MDVRRASPNIKCQAFELTLSGIALEWFRGLKPRSITSFDQLRTEFVSRFIGLKTRKNDKTYLWSLKQGKAETLKSYIRRFTKEINTVEGFTDVDVIGALREGLQEGEQLRSMVRKEPKTFTEFLTRAQEYIKVDDYLQSRKEHKGEGKRKGESEAKTEKAEENEKPKVETKQARNEAKPPLADKFRAYTPLTTTPDQILMQIENRNLLTPPVPLREIRICEIEQSFVVFIMIMGT